MARLIVLGSAAAVSDAEHDNTHFLLLGDNGSRVLVDCGSNPLGKLSQFGVGPDDLNDLILTHFHPDHVGGVPILLMQMWLLGRQRPLNLHGLYHCLNHVENTGKAFLFDTWPRFFSIVSHYLPEQPAALVLDNDDFRITSWPTKHFIPTIGLRIEVKTSGQVVAYSGDTEPVSNIIDLARHADLLIHEAAGEGFGHSSATQAGEVATAAGAKHLALIHYQVLNTDPRPLVDEARATFAGPVDLAEDYTIFDL